MFHTQAGYDFYCKYIAIKRHFDGNYDYHKYRGKLKLTISAYQARRDSLMFEKMAKILKPEEYEDFIVAHIKEDKGTYVRDMRKSVYQKHIEDMAILPKLFREDLDRLREVSQMMLISNKGKIPEIYKWSMGKKVRIESIICLDYVYPFLEKHQDEVKFNLMEEHFYLILNYKPFVLKYLNSNYKSIVKQAYMT
jgi:hypothetical protein